MRVSQWKIIWDALGDSPVTLLDYGDLMENETTRSLEQLVDIGVFDFAPSVTIASRANLKRRLEFSRRIEHASAAASWAACQTAVFAGPWGTKAILKVTPAGGADKLYQAALLSSRHTPATDGALPESVHSYALRIAPYNLVDVGGPISIVGGFFLDAVNVTIVIEHTGSSPLQVGDLVYFSGGQWISSVVGDAGTEAQIIAGGSTSGSLPAGYYPVTKVGSSTGTGTSGTSTTPVTIQSQAPPAVTAKQAASTIPNASGTNNLPSSPFGNTNPPNYYAAVKRDVVILSELPYQICRTNLTSGVKEWVTVGTGKTTITGGYDGGLVSNGTWSGLTSTSGGRNIAYSGSAGSVPWRTMGGGTQSISVDTKVTGTVTYNGSNSAVIITTLPPLVMVIPAQGSAYTSIPSLEAAGTLQKKAAP